VALRLDDAGLVARQPGEHDHGRVSQARTQLFEQRQGIHAFDAAREQPGAIVPALEELAHRCRLGGRVDAVARAFQHHRQVLGGDAVGLGEEHAHGAVGLALGRAQHRQLEEERGAAAGAVLEADAALHQLDQALADGEARGPCRP
jgi:hypothetical protein